MNIPGDEFYILILDTLKNRGAETLQRALYLALREAILHGRLQAESRLPGSRVIARQLGLSRNTVNAALEQLTLEGYLLRNRRVRGLHSWQSAILPIRHPSLSSRSQNAFHYFLRLRHGNAGSCIYTGNARH
jgi:GntR family transcriptional regulator/MocR family aminotransferase